MFRVKVLLTSGQGNPKELTTICKDQPEVLRRVAMYTERYPGAEIFSEELVDAIPAGK